VRIALTSLASDGSLRLNRLESAQQCAGNCDWAAGFEKQIVIEKKLKGKILKYKDQSDRDDKRFSHGLSFRSNSGDGTEDDPFIGSFDVEIRPEEEEIPVSTGGDELMSPCETYLASIFTDDPKAFFVDVNDGNGYDPIQDENKSYLPYGSKAPLVDGKFIGTPGETHNHIYNDPFGDIKKNTNIYAPAGGKILDSGKESTSQNYVTIYYPKFGKETDVVLQIFHIENFNKELIGKSTGKGILLGQMGPNGEWKYNALDGKDSVPIGWHIHINATKKWWGIGFKHKTFKRTGKNNTRFQDYAARKHIRLSSLCK